MSDIDQELAEVSNKIKEFSEWLDEQFGSDCPELDYTLGCLSCDTGMALTYLGRIRKTLQPPKPHTPITEGDYNRG